MWNFQGDTSEAGFYRIICEGFFFFPFLVVVAFLDF